MISGFAKKLLLFVCMLLAFMVGGYFVASRINSDSRNFVLKKDNKVLLVGHSHTACAVDPAVATSVANFSASGESYFYMGAKVRSFVESNKDLKTVMIAISNNFVSKELDTWVAGDFFIANFMPKYFSILSQTERDRLFVENRSAFMYTLARTALDNMFYAGYRFGNYSSVLGGFERLEGNLDQWTTNVSIRSPESIPSDTVSILNLQYLESMVAYLKERDIQVILIRTPLHSSYWEKCKNEELFQKVIREKFSSYQFVDFKDYHLTDSDFHDPEHLNAEGAEKFSRHLEDVLKNI